jgi:hypothetical protein
MLPWTLLLPQHVRHSSDSQPTRDKAPTPGTPAAQGSAGLLHQLLISTLTAVVRRPHEPLSLALAALQHAHPLPATSASPEAAASKHKKRKRTRNDHDALSAPLDVHREYDFSAQPAVSIVAGGRAGRAAAGDVRRRAAHAMLIFAAVRAAVRVFKGAHWGAQGLVPLNALWAYLSGVAALACATSLQGRDSGRHVAAALLAMTLSELEQLGSSDVATVVRGATRAAGDASSTARHTTALPTCQRQGAPSRDAAAEGTQCAAVRVEVSGQLWRLAGFLDQLTVLSGGGYAVPAFEGATSKRARTGEAADGEARAVQHIVRITTLASASRESGSVQPAGAALAAAQRVASDGNAGVARVRGVLLATCAFALSGAPSLVQGNGTADLATRPVARSISDPAPADCATLALLAGLCGMAPPVPVGTGRLTAADQLSHAHGTVATELAESLALDMLAKQLQQLPCAHRALLVRTAAAQITSSAGQGCSNCTTTARLHSVVLACAICSHSPPCEVQALLCPADAGAENDQLLAYLHQLAISPDSCNVAGQIAAGWRLWAQPGPDRQLLLPTLLQLHDAMSKQSSRSHGSMSSSSSSSTRERLQAAAATLLATSAPGSASNSRARAAAFSKAQAHAAAALAAEAWRLVLLMPAESVRAALCTVASEDAGSDTAVALATLTLEQPQVSSAAAAGCSAANLLAPVLKHVLHHSTYPNQDITRTQLRLLNSAFLENPPPSPLHAMLRVRFASQLVTAAASAPAPEPMLVRAAAHAVAVSAEAAAQAASALAALLRGCKSAEGAERIVFGHCDLVAAVLELAAAGAVDAASDESDVQQLAAAVRPMALKATLSAQGARLEALRLARLCLALTPLAPRKLAAFVCRYAPASGLPWPCEQAAADASHDIPPHSSCDFALQRMQLAVDVVARSAHAVLPDLAAPAQSPDDTSPHAEFIARVLPVAVSEKELCSDVGALLTCAARTLSAAPHAAVAATADQRAVSFETQPTAPAGSPTEFAAHGAATGMERTVRSWLDGVLGDLVSAFSSETLQRSSFAALTVPATLLLEQLTAGRQEPGAVDAERVRSVRRLWAALFREEGDVESAASGKAAAQSVSLAEAVDGAEEVLDAGGVLTSNSELEAQSEEMQGEPTKGKGAVSSPVSTSNDGSDDEGAATKQAAKFGTRSPSGGSESSSESDSTASPNTGGDVHMPHVAAEPAGTAAAATGTAAGARPASPSSNPAVAQAALRALEALLCDDGILSALFDRRPCRCARCCVGSSTAVAGDTVSAGQQTHAERGERLTSVPPLCDDCAAVPANVQGRLWPLESLVALMDTVPLGESALRALGVCCELLNLLEVRLLRLWPILSQVATRCAPDDKYQPPAQTRRIHLCARDLPALHCICDDLMASGCADAGRMRRKPRDAACNHLRGLQCAHAASARRAGRAGAAPAAAAAAELWRDAVACRPGGFAAHAEPRLACQWSQRASRRS